MSTHALGRYEEAIVDYDEAVRLRPDYAEAHNNRGNVHHALGRYEEAIADYDEAIRLQPDDATAYNNRGKAHANLGWYEEAITDYDEAIRLQPDYATAYYNRGNAHADLGRHEKAITDLETAAELAQAAGDDDLAATIEESARSSQKPMTAPSWTGRTMWADDNPTSPPCAQSSTRVH